MLACVIVYVWYILKAICSVSLCNIATISCQSHSIRKIVITVLRFNLCLKTICKEIIIIVCMYFMEYLKS